jgi:hypothetical protein
MASERAAEIIKEWPEASREAAQLVLDAHGEPDEVTPSNLVWYDVSGCKRVIASKAYFHHDFPVAHTDSVESVIDLRVPPEKFSHLARFDGSVVAERTAGEVSARCHDEQANFLALNLTRDIISGVKTPEEARAYYGKEFLDFRRGKPTPYMDRLRVGPPTQATTDPDQPTLTDADLKRAAEEGKIASTADKEAAR